MLYGLINSDIAKAFCRK